MPKPVEIDTPSDREVRMRRTFDAAPALVFDAHTVPGLLKRWYGPPGWEMVLCDMDLRPGGTFRIVTKQPGGREIGQYGVYREVIRPTRIVNTENWEDWNPGEVLVTSVFESDGTGTLLSVTTRFPTKDIRDQLIAAGMTDGAEAAYAKLDAVLADHQTR